MHFFLHYLLVAGLFAVIDAIWLSVVANKFYKDQLGDLLLKKPKFGPAVLFYAISVFGIVIFAVNPALGAKSLSYAVGHGALLGLVTYATYDLTNLSTLKKWPVKITVVDMLWGTTVTTLVTVVAFHILR
jgi:uncharacterized membrane protein